MRNDRLVLDTHVWKAYVEGAGISAKVVKRIDAAGAGGALFIAAMTVWEVAMLAARGQIKLNGPTLQWVSHAVGCIRQGSRAPLLQKTAPGYAKPEALPPARPRGQLLPRVRRHGSRRYSPDLAPGR